MSRVLQGGEWAREDEAGSQTEWAVMTQGGDQPTGFPAGLGREEASGKAISKTTWQ